MYVSSGPSLLQAAEIAHGSASTIVDKVTKAKIPMVTGGTGNGGTLDVNRTANQRAVAMQVLGAIHKLCKHIFAYF